MTARKYRFIWKRRINHQWKNWAWRTIKELSFSCAEYDYIGPLAQGDTRRKTNKKHNNRAPVPTLGLKIANTSGAFFFITCALLGNARRFAFDWFVIKHFQEDLYKYWYTASLYSPRVLAIQELDFRSRHLNAAAFFKADQEFNLFVYPADSRLVLARTERVRDLYMGRAVSIKLALRMPDENSILKRKIVHPHLYRFALYRHGSAGFLSTWKFFNMLNSCKIFSQERASILFTLYSSTRVRFTSYPPLLSSPGTKRWFESQSTYICIGTWRVYLYRNGRFESH